MSDELIYKVKLVADDKSLAELKKQIAEAEKQSSTTSSSGGSKSKTEDIEKQTRAIGTLISAQKDLTKEYQKETTTLAGLQTLIDSYKGSLGELNRIKKEEGSLTSEQSMAQAGLKTLLKESQSDYNKQTTAIIANKKASEQLDESYKGIQARMSAISSRIKELNPNIQKENEERQRLIKTYSELNTKLKDVDKSMGNMQRNVGNYEDSLRGFANALAVIQGPLGPIAGRINSLATVITRYRAATESATVATGLYGKALILLSKIPIVAVIAALAVAFTSLINFFKRSEEGQNAFAVRMAKIGRVVELVKDTFADFGKILYSVFTFNLGDAKDALNDMIGTMGRFLNISQEMEQAGDIQTQFNNIKRLEREYGVLVAAKQRDLQVTRQIARDESVNVYERIKAIQDEMKSQNELFEVERQIALERLKATDAQVAATKSDSQALQDLADARKDYFAVEEKMAETQMRLTRDLNGLVRKSIDQEIALLRTANQTKMLLRKTENDAIINQYEMQYNRRASLEFQLSEIGKDSADKIEEQTKALTKLGISEGEARVQAEARVNAEVLASRQQLQNQIAQLNQDVSEKMRTLELEQNKIANQMIFDDSINSYRERYDKIGEIKFRIMSLEMNREIEFEQRVLDLKKQNIDEENAIRIANIELDNKYALERMSLQQEAMDTQRDQLRELALIENELRESTIAFGNRKLIESLRKESSDVEVAKKELALLEEEIERTKQERIRELTLSLTKQIGDEVRALELAQDQIRLEDDQRLYDAQQALIQKQVDDRINAAKVIANALGAFNSAFFNDSKELAVAQTIVNTYAGAMAAFKDTPGNIAIRSLAAAAAVATGIANVKKILATKLGDKGASKDTTQQPNITTGFGLVDVGTNAPIASQVAMDAGMARGNMNPTFVFQGDLDPEIMAIKVNQGSNAISSRTLGVGI
jgi:hypothetical protein